MSLINDMLKDLDSRRGPASGAQLAALQGMGLASVNQVQWRYGLSYSAWGLGGILAVFLGYQASLWWMSEADTITEAAPVIKNVEPEENTRSDKPPVRARVAERTIAAAAQTRPIEQPAGPPAPLEKTGPVVARADKPVKAVSKPVKTLTPKQKAERWFAKAQHALAGHRQRNGEKLLQRTLDAFPRHVEARTQLAALLVNQQRADDAEQLLAQGLVYDSGRFELAIPYAQLLAAREALAPALETLDRALSQSTPDAEAQALRAAVLHRMDRHTDSAAAYRQALRAQPNQALWWTGLAVALEHDNQQRQALNAYRRASQLPLDKAVHDYVNQRIQALHSSDTHY